MDSLKGKDDMNEFLEKLTKLKEKDKDLSKLLD